MQPDTRYQVFVSSTFVDLKDERQAAMRAILELGHMPAGMELFPAVDDSAWQLIKDVIDRSDYYVVIVGGRYGSSDKDGLGFTEKEYDYAISAGKRIVPLLHETPSKLPRDKTEESNETWKKVLEFRTKIEKAHTCAYWATVESLSAKLIVGLTATFKRYPGIGWIRADLVPNNATVADVLRLRQEVDRLEAQLAEQGTRQPPGTEDLMQGEDIVEIRVAIVARNTAVPFDRKKVTGKVQTTWNRVFVAVAPCMIQEASHEQIKRELKGFLRALAIEQLIEPRSELRDRSIEDFEVADQPITTCIVQFRALGLIQESVKKRSIHDTDVYWKLTPYGDRQMMLRRALRRSGHSGPSAISSERSSTPATVENTAPRTT